MSYVIREIEGRGRALIATRNIEQGEVIVVEEPYGLIVSDQYRDNVCAFCGRLRSDGTMYVLNPEDSVKYCSEHCITVDYGIHSLELDALKLLKNVSLKGIASIDSVRLIIRCGCIKKAVQEKKIADLPSTFESIMSLEAIGTGIDVQSMVEIDAIVDKLEKICKIRKIPLVFAEIKSILLAIQCNAHRILVDDRPIALGLFPLISMINHSCVPNCTHYFELSDRAKAAVPSTTQNCSRPKMIIRAIATIPEGTEVVYSYVPLYQSTANRRAQLKAAYSFECRCDKCTRSSALEEGISYPVGSAQDTALTHLKNLLQSAPSVNSSNVSTASTKEAIEYVRQLTTELFRLVSSGTISPYNQCLLQSYTLVAGLSVLVAQCREKDESVTDREQVLRTGVLSSLFALGCIYQHISTVEFETVSIEVGLVRLLDGLIASEDAVGVQLEQITLEEGTHHASADTVVKAVLTGSSFFGELPTVMLDLLKCAVKTLKESDSSSEANDKSTLVQFRDTVFRVANSHNRVCRGADIEL